MRLAVSIQGGEELRPYHAYVLQSWITDCIIDDPNFGDVGSYYTFHAFNPKNGDETLAQKVMKEEELTTSETIRRNKVFLDIENYLNWPCDFEVYFDKSVNGTNYGIAGNYGDYGWLNFDGIDLNPGERVQLLHSYIPKWANQFTYQVMLAIVYQFHCGIYSDNINDMKGTTFSVELCMYHPDNNSDKQIKILVSKTDYKF